MVVYSSRSKPNSPEVFHRTLKTINKMCLTVLFCFIYLAYVPFGEMSADDEVCRSKHT